MVRRVIVGNAMNDYRLEAIVDLHSNKAVGHELLAGARSCPNWQKQEWQDWYAFLAQEIPQLLPSLPGPLFLNLDGYQALYPHIRHSIHLLSDCADRIVLEWTERRFHEKTLTDVLAEFRFLSEKGFRIAIDDIGAVDGIDGIGRAGAIQASYCKIDGPYFQKARGKAPEYLRGLCQHLSQDGALVVVEWVETEADYRLALASGAHLGQGWYWNGRG